MKVLKKALKHTGKRGLAIIMAGALSLPVAFSFIPKIKVEAARVNNAITYEYYTTTLGNQVPPCWLFVGTYLMSVKGVTPQIYKLALETRDTYEQPIAFYTSELDRGYWKNVEGAEALSTILPVAQTVKEEDMYPYLITAVVGDDGIPLDPVSGKPIDVFNINSPYEMENIPELKEILDYYEGGELQKNNSPSNKYLYSILNTFFENDNLDTFDRANLDVNKAYDQYNGLLGSGNKDSHIKLETYWSQALLYNPVMYPTEYKDIMMVMQSWSNVRDNLTDRTDTDMENLNALFLKLQERRLQEEADAALAVEAEIDAERRSEVYYNLVSNKNLTGSYNPYSGIDNFGVAPTLLFLRDAAKTGKPDFGRIFSYTDYGTIRIPIFNYYIQRSFVENKELSETVAKAITKCSDAYTYYEKRTMMRGTTPADYAGYLFSRMIADNSKDIETAMPYLQMYVDWSNIEGDEIIHKAREISILQEYMIPFSAADFLDKKTEDSVDNYQYYIRSLTNRDTVENSIAFVEDRLEYAHSLDIVFSNVNKTDRLQAHIVWLNNLLRSLKNQSDDEDGGSDDTTSKLKEDMKEALDEGNLVEAKKIADYLNKIEPGGGNLDDENGTGDSGESDLGPSDINPANRPKAEEVIKQIIYEDIKKEDYDPTKDLDKLNKIGGDLDEVMGEIGRDLNPDFYENKVEEADTAGDEGGDTGDKNEGTDVGTEDIDKALENVLGDKDKMNSKAKATAAAALTDMLDKNPSNDLEAYLKDLIAQLLGEGNPYIYRQYMRDQSMEYVSLGSVDNCRSATGFRYVEEESASETTMSQIFGGSASYTFILYSKEVIKNTGEKDLLTVNAVEQTDKYIKTKKNRKYTYIFEDDAKKFMGVTCRYVRGTDYAILVTEGMDPKIKAIVDLLENSDNE